MNKTKVAIIGSGNIGTDLMIKIMRLSKSLEMSVFVGIDPESDGLARAERMGVATSYEGVDGLIKMKEWADVKIVFDATSAKAHLYNWGKIQAFPDKKMIDLTPAAVGPYLVPPVNFLENMDVPNVNMVTCGGQATIPMVAAVNRVAKVHYGEIVASIASKSAGPGTRANIDEFTETTREAIEKVGGAEKGKAIIILNPAEPPLPTTLDSCNGRGNITNGNIGSSTGRMLTMLLPKFGKSFGEGGSNCPEGLTLSVVYPVIIW